MMNSGSNYLNHSPNFESEFRCYSCPVSYCDKDAFTPLALKRHLERQHYSCAVARAAAALVVKFEKLQEEVKC